MLKDLSATTSWPLFEEKKSDPFSSTLDGIYGALDAAAGWLSGSDSPNVMTRGAEGVLFKAPKLGQDRRADLPTIGPNTVVNVKKAKLKGIILDSNGVIVLSLEEVIDLCNESDIFLQVRAIH